MYIYAVKSGHWQHHSTAPIWLRVLSYLTAAAVLFFLFHTLMLFVYSTEIDNGDFYIAAWTQEIYFNVWVAAPLFLALCGRSFGTERIGKMLLIFTVLFGIFYLVNIGNTYEWLDIAHLQYPMSALLLCILITWSIIAARRKKTVLDGLKFVWLFGFIYAFIVPRFVPSGHQAGNFLLASMFIFPFMMTLGFVQFFRKPKNTEHAA